MFSESVTTNRLLLNKEKQVYYLVTVRCGDSEHHSDSELKKNKSLQLVAVRRDWSEDFDIDID